jgi:predicted acyl esterase
MFHVIRFIERSSFQKIAWLLIVSSLLTVQAEDRSDGMEWARAGADFDASRILEALGTNTTHKSYWVPMRDGVRLATEIFFPEGDGPWPVVLMRTPYGRVQVKSYAKQYKDQGVVLITQDTRGRYDSEGEIGLDNYNEIADGYDTLDWVAQRSWCNGRIGMIGGSGNGVCARMAFYSNHPNLTVVWPGNTGSSMPLYWSHENGVLRWLGVRWCGHFRSYRNDITIPDTFDFDRSRWEQVLEDGKKNTHTVLHLDDGWFNCFQDNALDEFAALAETCTVYGEIRAGAHYGLIPEQRFKPRRYGVEGLEPIPSFLEILKGAEPAAKSRMVYFVMGDRKNPEAPGNVSRVAYEWPPPHKDTEFYMYADGSLSQKKPRAEDDAVSYTYDPNDPAPSLGGGYSYDKVKAPSGPYDQRPLKDRQDMLTFYTDELTEPLDVVGKLKARLFIESDVPDSTFMVKVVDVYPDGEEMILREGAAMARYRDGFENPEPMKPGKVYELEFPLNSTAIVFDKGHKIGMYVTSSSDPAYQVHPNTFDAVGSLSEANIAHHRIHLSASHPSCLILPVTQ